MSSGFTAHSGSRVYDWSRRLVDQSTALIHLAHMIKPECQIMGIADALNLNNAFTFYSYHQVSNSNAVPLWAQSRPLVFLKHPLLKKSFFF
jgi:hypothetical protein